MKRIFLLSLVLMLSLCGVVYAAGINGQYKGKDIVKVSYEGKEVKTDAVPGYIENGNTMVPLGLLRKMGITVEWNAKTLTANVKLPTRTVPVLIQSQLEELAKSVYKISTAPTKDYPTGKQGSGFIIDGHVITAGHVASDAEFAEVLIDGSWQKSNKYDFVSTNPDVMGFKVTGGKSLPYSTELPQVGDPVYSIGYPQGVLTITDGEVLEIWPANETWTNAEGLTISSDNGVNIKHSAKTESGSSGGVLLNGKGEVIGINVSTLAGDNLALAIQEAIKELKK